MAGDRKQDMEQLLERQRAAFIAARPEGLGVRRRRIEQAMALLDDNADALNRAMSADFGNRSQSGNLGCV